jgi:poly(hydroxyalkanoate) granule-associated protein
MPKGETQEATETTAERSLGAKALLVGLGVVEVAIESSGQLFDYLVDKGESFEERHREDVEGAKQRARGVTREAGEKIKATWNRVSSTVDSKVSTAFSRAGVSGSEIENLKVRVEDLAAKVEGMRPETAKV